MKLDTLLEQLNDLKSLLGNPEVYIEWDLTGSFSHIHINAVQVGTEDKQKVISLIPGRHVFYDKLLPKLKMEK